VLHAKISVMQKADVLVCCFGLRKVHNPQLVHIAPSLTAQMGMPMWSCPGSWLKTFGSRRMFGAQCYVDAVMLNLQMATHLVTLGFFCLLLPLVIVTPEVSTLQSQFCI
jgi:hypothetical protein